MDVVDLTEGDRPALENGRKVRTAVLKGSTREVRGEDHRVYECLHSIQMPRAFPPVLYWTFQLLYQRSHPRTIHNLTQHNSDCQSHHTCTHHIPADAPASEKLNFSGPAASADARGR